MNENNTHSMEGTEATAALLAAALNRFSDSMEWLERIADSMECLCNRLDRLAQAVDPDEQSLVVNNYPADRWVGCNYEQCPRALWTPPEAANATEGETS